MDEIESAHCKLSNRSFHPKKKLLRVHVSSAEHKCNENVISAAVLMTASIKPAKAMIISDQVKQIEVKLVSVTVCCHSSLSTLAGAHRRDKTGICPSLETGTKK